MAVLVNERERWGEAYIHRTGPGFEQELARSEISKVGSTHSQPLLEMLVRGPGARLEAHWGREGFFFFCVCAFGESREVAGSPMSPGCLVQMWNSQWYRSEASRGREERRTMGKLSFRDVF